MSERVERRLAAILSADVVAYSRLMEADESGTLARLTANRRELFEPEIARHNGRTVKLMGDGLLAEFASVIDAVACAVAIQRGMAHRHVVTAESQRIEWRIGINLGDVIVEGDDIYGDGVNISARLQAMAPPNGLCVSDIVYQSIDGKLDLAFESLGKQTMKNITRPVDVWRWRDDRGAGDIRDEAAPEITQEIRFCESDDGVQLAIATAGAGTPLIKTPNWMNHLEYDWDSPVFRPLLVPLAQHHLLIRYDQRGHGLSDWTDERLSLDDWVRDLEAVVEAVGVERFALLGISQGCPVSIAYAARHPERVTRLLLHGGTARGWMHAPTPEVAEQHAAMLTLIRRGWGKDTSGLRQLFTSLFIPGATTAEGRWFDEVQRVTSNPENAARLYDTFGHTDVVDLARQVKAPTLVTHSRGDLVVPHKAGRAMAAQIPGARFVTIESDNHVLLEEEPAFARFVDEVTGFLGADAG